MYVQLNRLIRCLVLAKDRLFQVFYNDECGIAVLSIGFETERLKFPSSVGLRSLILSFRACK